MRAYVNTQIGLKGIAARMMRGIATTTSGGMAARAARFAMTT